MGALSPIDPARRCPCGSGELFGACCEPVIAGRPASSAVQLMRSRYTAFVLEDADYLLDSWHPTTRPTTLHLDPDIRWRRLEVLQAQAGGPFDAAGVVEFRAFYRAPDGAGTLHERSRFGKEYGRWRYIDGEQLSS